MWRLTKGREREDLLKRAIKFTGNANLYGSWMIKVLDKWPCSCEHNLSDITMNRQAWIGHAACCLAIGCSEEITRLAWHHLTQRQQDEANAMADKAIVKWEKEYIQRKNKQLSLF